jgi:hypothetical protein
MDQAIAILQKAGFSEDAIQELVAAAAFATDQGGVDVRTYWNTDELSSRDEYFVVANCLIAIMSMSHDLRCVNPWMTDFWVGFLLQMKSNLQAIKSIDLLARDRCYFDAFSICRTVNSRANLLMLIAANPKLHDRWLKQARDEMFGESHVRQELLHCGFETMDHLYAELSDVVYSSFMGLAERGLLAEGHFPHLPAIENAVYVTAKFLFAMSCRVALSMIQIDEDGQKPNPRVKSVEIILNHIVANYLPPTRLENLFVTIAEERNWEKVGKEKHKIGGAYAFDAYHGNLQKFHRLKQQRKKMSKKYDVS